MTVPKSISILAARFCVCLCVAGRPGTRGLHIGHGPSTAPTTKADQKQMLEKDVDQTAKNESRKEDWGRRSWPRASSRRS